MERVILHLDMDAFYAAVEVREEPELAGKPLIIGYPGRRGVVSTASYEARRYGVRSAMPSVTAMRLCPNAVWRPGRMSLYSEVSREIRKQMANVTPVVEPLSIDEAFLDLTGIAADLDDGARIARDLKKEIRACQRLSASVGVAPNKFLAKVASDMDKPDGLTLLPVSALAEKFWPLPVERLWGVGPATAKRLHEGRIRLVGDVAKADPEHLRRLVGAGSAEHLHALAHGRDRRPVVSSRKAKSISEERTYAEDLTTRDEIDRALLARAAGVSRQLRRQGLVGRTIHLKVRTGDFTTWTRSATLAEAADMTGALVAAARELFRDRIRLRNQGVRLLGLGVSGLEKAGSGQGRLFTDPREERARRIAAAADTVREKLGRDAITRARLLDGKNRKEKGEASSLPSVD